MNSRTRPRRALTGSMRTMLFGVPAVLSVLAAAPGCRPEGDGVAVARLGAERTAVAPASGVARRLWVGEYTDFYASGVSPDGRYVTQVDWPTGDLAVRDLATGKLHSDVELLRVPLDGSAVERVATIPDYDTGAVLHPDGRTIAYRTGRWRGEIWALDGLGGSASTATEMEGSR